MSYPYLSDWSPENRVDALLTADRDARILAADLELDDLSAEDVRRMSMSEFAALRRRAGLPDIPPPQVTQAARAQSAPATQAPTEARSPVSGDAVGTQYAGHSVESMDWQTYADFRRTIGLDRPGRGLFD